MLKLKPTLIPGSFLIDESPFEDERGVFSKVFEGSIFDTHIDNQKVRQINTSFNKHAGTIRGFHFQNGPTPEFKIVKCISGSIFDVILDARPTSPSYGMLQSFDLKGSEQTSLLIPPGVAHAFQSLENDTNVLYAHTADYIPKYNQGYNALQKELRITWPLPMSSISTRDRALPNFVQDHK